MVGCVQSEAGRAARERANVDGMPVLRAAKVDVNVTRSRGFGREVAAVGL
jgi:hypothetical protein